MSLLSTFQRASLPSVAVELASNRVSAVSVEHRSGGAVVAAHATEPVPAGALAPSLTAPNLRERGVVAGALARVLDKVGRPKRVGLVIPDPVARVSLVRFERVPGRRQDLDQLVRWQVKKGAPFPIDEAQVAYAPGFAGPEGQEFVVSVARRDIVEEYEGVCADAGAHAGLVDLATFNVVNAVLAGTAGAGDSSTRSGPSQAPSVGDWLLVNVTVDYASIVILRGEHPIFFRNRTSEADGSLSDIVHQAAMYYEDRLSGSGFARVVLSGAAGALQTAEVDLLRRGLEARLDRPVESVDPRLAVTFTDRIAVAPVLLDTLAPLIGLLLRGQEAGA